MSESPHKNSDGVIRVSVFSEGKPLKTTLFALISVYIRKEVNRIGTAVLVFDAGNMSEGEMPESDDESLAPGKQIRIEAGYAEDENPLFEGTVTSHQLDIQEGNVSTLRIECRDYAFPSTQMRKNKVFEKKKDSEAMTEILREYSPLSAVVDTTTTKHNELVQYNCTDWDFLLSRAQANGLVVTVDGKKINVMKPDVTKSPPLKVTYGMEIIAFNGELCAEEQATEYKAVAWDMSQQKIITVNAKKPALNKQGKDTPDQLAKAIGSNKYTSQTVLSDEGMLQAWADAQSQRVGLSRIQGQCKFTGNHKALPGDLLLLDGLGKRFNGNAYIGWVEHEIVEGVWTTTTGFGIPASVITEQADVMTPSASGLIPGVEGLHIGKVLKLDGDPTGEDKIQIELPILNGDVNTVWARLGNFWASSSYGSFFIPDISDEVVVGFFNNDPCHAVVIGSLYSSKQAPPYQLTKENKIRAIYTKSKMKIEFEEENKVITIETPGKNRIQISDKDKSILLEDQHKNKIEMNSSGILIDSSKEITLKAKTNIVLDAGANLNMKAKSNAETKAMNIKEEASMAFTAKGNAKAELTASGQTVVKGAMVMIN